MHDRGICGFFLGIQHIHGYRAHKKAVAGKANIDAPVARADHPIESNVSRCIDEVDGDFALDSTFHDQFLSHFLGDVLEYGADFCVLKVLSYENRFFCQGGAE